jgi:transposase
MGMMNDRLRDALMTGKMTNEDLAANLGVSAKTVERWITQARTPYPQFRHRISVLVQKDERWLWPDGYSHRRRGEITESEIVKVYPYRFDVPDELRAKLFDRAIDQIGILV